MSDSRRQIYVRNTTSCDTLEPITYNSEYALIVINGTHLIIVPSGFSNVYAAWPFTSVYIILSCICKTNRDNDYIRTKIYYDVLRINYVPLGFTYVVELFISDYIIHLLP